MRVSETIKTRTLFTEIGTFFIEIGTFFIEIRTFFIEIGTSIFVNLLQINRKAPNVFKNISRGLEHTRKTVFFFCDKQKVGMPASIFTP